MKSFLSLWALGLFCLASYSQAQPIPLHGQRLASPQPVPLQPPQQDLESGFAQPVKLFGFEDLVEAAKNSESDKVQILIDAGVDPNPPNLYNITGMLTNPSSFDSYYRNRRMTPLMWGARNGDAEIVQMLIEAGANPNAYSYNGFTALIHAAYEGHVEVIQKLLDAGVNPNTYSSHPYNFKILAATALHWAERRGHEDVAQMLRDAGAI